MTEQTTTELETVEQTTTELETVKTEHALLLALQECQFLGHNIIDDDLRARAQKAHDLIYGVLHKQ